MSASEQRWAQVTLMGPERVNGCGISFCKPAGYSRLTPMQHEPDVQLLTRSMRHERISCRLRRTKDRQPFKNIFGNEQFVNDIMHL